MFSWDVIISISITDATPIFFHHWYTIVQENLARGSHQKGIHESIQIYAQWLIIQKKINRWKQPGEQ